MLRRLHLKTALMGLVALAFTTPALANNEEVAATANVMGSWTFSTDAYRDGECLLTGLMHIMPGEDARNMRCEMTASEECNGAGRSLALQSCTISRDGANLNIQSEIREMLELEIEGLVYRPDNFTLEIESGAKMEGLLRSASEAPVTFTRSMGGIS